MSHLLHGAPTFHVLVLLGLAGLLAGFVDAAVGGGGLITIPALLLGLPGVPKTTILGINKVQSCTGTTVAAGKFMRSGVLHWHELVGPVLAAMAGAYGGVALAYYLQNRFDVLFTPLMIGLMALMLAFTLLKPDLGHVHAPRFGQTHQRGLAMLIALLLGFYDGLFGPGVGSLLIFLFVAVLGFDFLCASALAKGVNWASNLASTVIFLWHGSWIPVVALAMALGNGVGGWLGAHVAIEKGSRWVRWMFVGVVSALILRLGWKAIGGGRV